MPSFISATVRFLSGSWLFSGLQNYTMAGTQATWLPGKGVPITGGGIWRNEAAAAAAVVLGQHYLRNHALYYYVQHYFEFCARRFSGQAAEFGVDLAGVDALNGLLSVDEGLTDQPSFPVDPSQAP